MIPVWSSVQQLRNKMCCPTYANMIFGLYDHGVLTSIVLTLWFKLGVIYDHTIMVIYNATMDFALFLTWLIHLFWLMLVGASLTVFYNNTVHGMQCKNYQVYSVNDNHRRITTIYLLYVYDDDIQDFDWVFLGNAVCKKLLCWNAY